MGTSTLFRYYQILGVPEQAGPEELKQAYRQKAKQLHPDRNKAPEAHGDFILLNEAYEYLLSLKTNKHPLRSDQDLAEARYRQEWYRQERVRARQRAQAYAQMQYEEFLKSDQYKLSSSWATVWANPSANTCRNLCPRLIILPATTCARASPSCCRLMPNIFAAFPITTAMCSCTT